VSLWKAVSLDCLKGKSTALKAPKKYHFGVIFCPTHSRFSLSGADLRAPYHVFLLFLGLEPNSSFSPDSGMKKPVLSL
jgi:hypothetical protein